MNLLRERARVRVQSDWERAVWRTVFMFLCLLVVCFVIKSFVISHRIKGGLNLHVLFHLRHL
jgi:hypothetical protein